MTFTRLAFSTEGRINRATFWKAWVILLLAGWIGATLVTAPAGAVAPLGWLLLAALVWPAAAVTAKRCHDLDKSAWWCLLLAVPVAGLFWLLVEPGFFHGTSGPNRFGYPADLPGSDARPAPARGHRHGASRRLPASYPDLMALFAKLAKCDGPISREEIRVVDSFLSESLTLPEPARKEAIREFRAARDSRMSFESHARRFYTQHAHHQQFLAEIVDMLVTLALADGNLKRREALFLDLVVAIFGVSSQRYYQCKYGDSGPRVEAVGLAEEREYARVLGLGGRVTRDEIRRAYRELVGQYHPDKVSHLGPRLREVAENEIKKINEAYEYFRKKYDL